MKEKIENLLPKDPELADLVEKCQVDLVAQRASSYRKSSSLKTALGKLEVDYDDNALYSKVYRALKDIGWKCGELEKVKPNIPENTRLERLEFAHWVREQYSKDPNFHEKIIHTDECSVALNDTTDHNFRAWRREGEILEPAEFKVKRSNTIMCWAAVGVGFKSDLIFFC